MKQLKWKFCHCMFCCPVKMLSSVKGLKVVVYCFSREYSVCNKLLFTIFYLSIIPHEFIKVSSEISIHPCSCCLGSLDGTEEAKMIRLIYL